MWTPDIVKRRFFEACDIERRMVVKGGMSTGGNGWPSYIYDADDHKGWDDQAMQDNLERWQGRQVTKSPEITRWEEVFFEWTSIVPERHRKLVWRWAQCIASGRSFSKYCQEKGIVRITAYKRLDKVFDFLVTHFDLERRFLKEPEGKWAIQEDQIEAMEYGNIKNNALDRRSPEHPPFRPEKHHDALTTPAAIAAFAQHLADTNDERRKLQERRMKKAMRGAPAAA